jgi:NADH-quinone oxidoreductase subunit E
MTSHSGTAEKSLGKNIHPAETAQTDQIDMPPLDQMDKIIEAHRNKPGMLLGTLEELQNLNKYKYLPVGVLKYVSMKLNIPLSQVYSVVTFYSFFNLKPQGEHCITICRGTACHTKGSRVLLDGLKDTLKLKDDPAEDSEKVFLTTPDKKFTIRTIACFGQCALAPVCEVDGIIFSNTSVDKMRQVVDRIKAGGKANEN